MPENDAPAMAAPDLPIPESDRARAVGSKRCGASWVFDLPPNTPAVTAAQVAELLAEAP